MEQSKRDELVELYIKKAQDIAKEWTIAHLDGEDTHPKYANEMFALHNLAEETLKIISKKLKEEDKE